MELFITVADVFIKQAKNVIITCTYIAFYRVFNNEK